MHRLYRLFLILFVALCITYGADRQVFANFADTYGFSAAGVSRGNAMTAVAHDWSSVYYNMAGLGKTRGYPGANLADTSDSKPVVSPRGSKLSLKKKSDGSNDVSDVPASGPSALMRYHDQLGLSYMYTYPMMNINIPREDVTGDQNLEFGTITLGLVLDLNHFIIMPDFISSSRFGLGIGLMQDGTLVRVNDIDLRTHNYQRYGREAQRTVIFAGMGFGFVDDMFGIGLGAHVWTGGKGAVELEEVEVGGDEQMPEQQILMDLEPVYAPAVGLYFSPGKIWDAMKGLELGVAYRGELWMEIYPFDTNATLTMGGVTMVMGLAIYDYYTPHIISAGAAYTPLGILPDLTVSLDVEYQMWSRYGVSRAKEDYVEQYNEYNDPGDPDIELPEFRDIIVPKLGISYQLFSWMSVNAGYFYRMSFLEDDANNTVFNFLDNDTHVGSLGLTFIVPKKGPMVSPVEITIAGQFQYLVKQTVVKDDAFDDSATTNLNPSYNYEGMVPSGFVEVIMRW
ncbi:MAG: OmpP1/FadL family transporter [Spirochaetota bacterium]